MLINGGLDTVKCIEYYVLTGSVKLLLADKDARFRQQQHVAKWLY